jgi:hypothetical protein
MSNFSDEVHVVGMSENSSTYLTVSEVCDSDGNVVRVEPPINVVLEGKNIRSVAVTQNALAARYDQDELSQIGEGNPILGLDLVIGDVAVNGLTYGAIKPLHPTLMEAQIVDEVAELASPSRELTA